MYPILNAGAPVSWWVVGGAERPWSRITLTNAFGMCSSPRRISICGALPVSVSTRLERIPSRSTEISAVASSNGDCTMIFAVSPGRYSSRSATSSMRSSSDRSHAT